MKSVIDAIVSQDHMIKSATSTYVDDILINENRVPASCIQQHFLDYSLVSKNPVQLRDGARVLGLQVWEKDGTVMEPISVSTLQMNLSLMRVSSDNQRRWRGQRDKITDTTKVMIYCQIYRRVCKVCGSCMWSSARRVMLIAGMVEL